MKKIIVMALTALVLAACGNDTSTNEDSITSTVDLTEATTSYKTTLLVDATAFVEDTKVLQAAINNNQLDEAQKLYPLVHMSVEKFKPLQSQLKEQLALLDGPIKTGKELEGMGLHVLEYALFTKKDPALAKDAAQQVVDNALAFANDVAKKELQGQAILNDTASMLKFAIEDKLTNTEESISNTQMYDLEANVIAVQQVLTAYSSVGSETTVKALQEAITTVQEEMAFYQIGKEDYVAYNIFTNKQKQALIDDVKQLQASFQAFQKSIK
jgi:iron uptake system component EfeO